MLLAILIPTIKSRAAFLDRLMASMVSQLTAEIAAQTRLIVASDDGEVSIGVKRQRLLEHQQARAAQYICYFDDDDLPGPTYLADLVAALTHGPDCVGFRMRRFSDGQDIGEGVHSLAAGGYRQTPLPAGRTMYWRPPNHLNPVRRELALRAGFPNQNFAEDRAYAERLRPMLRTEVFVDAFLYEYWYRTPGNRPGERSNGG